MTRPGGHGEGAGCGLRTFDDVAHGLTQLLPRRCVASQCRSVAVAPDVCGHTEPHATQNSFPCGSCITTEYRCRVSIRNGWSTVAPDVDQPP